MYVLHIAGQVVFACLQTQPGREICREAAVYFHDASAFACELCIEISSHFDKFAIFSTVRAIVTHVYSKDCSVYVADLLGCLTRLSRWAGFPKPCQQVCAGHRGKEWARRSTGNFQTDGDPIKYRSTGPKVKTKTRHNERRKRGPEWFREFYWSVKYDVKKHKSRR
jgi:hypothetical protein